MKHLDDKKLKQIECRIRQHLTSRVIQTKQPKKNVEFFLVNANDSLMSAKALFDLSTNKDFQSYTHYEGLRGFLWVINASYYSMFYMVRALLAAKGVLIKSDLSVHSVTFDALIYFFYLNGNLEKHFFESYADAQEEASELLGKRKADEIVLEYYFEKDKRSTFTYETNEHAMQSKAKTSLDRAIKFQREIRKLIKKLP